MALYTLLLNLGKEKKTSKTGNHANGTVTPFSHKSNLTRVTH